MHRASISRKETLVAYEAMFETMLQVLRSGGSAMLLTIAEREGSAPRGIGTAMVVSDGGVQTGTIGGGEVEYRARLDAAELFEDGANGIREYLLYPKETDGLGMICGGRVRVLFRLFSGETSVRLIECALELLERGEEAYLVCAIDHGAVGGSEVLSCEEARLRTALRPHLSDRPVLTEDVPRRLIEPLRAAPRVIVFGGGHVSQKVAPLLSFIGYSVWILEDRAAFADAALFPSAARVLLISFDRAEAELNITPRDHVVVLTRGHESDHTILRWFCAHRRIISAASAAKQSPAHARAVAERRLYERGAFQAAFADRPVHRRGNARRDRGQHRGGTDSILRGQARVNRRYDLIFEGVRRDLRAGRFLFGDADRRTDGKQSCFGMPFVVYCRGVKLQIETDADAFMQVYNGNGDLHAAICPTHAHEHVRRGDPACGSGGS
jgi:xanthine dehydrogenase accessory factor